MSPIVSLPEFKWIEQPKEIEYYFPDSWLVEIRNMSGHNRRALAPGEIEALIRNPVNTTPISELAKGRKRIVVLFDDLTRVTRTYEIIPSVLKELDRVGVPKDGIRLIAATGLHGVMSQSDFIKKLGKDIVAEYAVYNHNPFSNCTYVGTTSTYQTRVHINEEVMNCDFKIAIGLVVPHHLSGFSGGGKIALPGVAGHETIQYNHMMGNKSREEHPDSPALGMGIYDNNALRRDIDEASRFVGIDFLINVIVNKWGETVAVYAGDMKAAYDAAIEAARSHYLTSAAIDNDVAIANNFSANNVTSIGLRIAFPAIKKSGGHIVLIANYPEGQIPHYLTGRWGKQTWASQYRKLYIPGTVNHLIVFNKFHKPGSSWFDEDDSISYFNRWEDVINYLQEFYHSDYKAVVYPNAEIQYSC